MSDSSSNSPPTGARPSSGGLSSAPAPKKDEFGKMPRERTETDSILSDDADGVKKAEAVVLAWSRNAVWGIYAW